MSPTICLLVKKEDDSSGMNIGVSRLAPGEAVLCQMSVDYFLNVLSQGSELPSITVFVDGSRWVVRDGNNRVRAYLEFCLGRNQEPSALVCVVKEPLDPRARSELLLAANHFGVGVEAFLALEIVAPADYIAAQAAATRRIRSTP